MRNKKSASSLIRGLRKQNPRMQRAAFDLYAGYLFRICYRYLHNKERAEEVISQVFLKAFAKIEFTDIEQEVKLKAWIKRIAINECLQELRKSVKFSGTFELNEDVQITDLQTDQELLEEDLIKMVKELPVGYRTVFSLYAIEGYAHKEIAEHLGISVGTSKSQLSKARKMLREQLTKNGIIAGI